MKGLILTTMLLLISFQVFCLVLSIMTKASPTDFMFGFAIWGSAPVLLLNILLLITNKNG